MEKIYNVKKPGTQANTFKGESARTDAIQVQTYKNKTSNEGRYARRNYRTEKEDEQRDSSSFALSDQTEIYDAHKIVLESLYTKRPNSHPFEPQIKQRGQGEAAMILRSHFANEIIENLEKIQSYAQQPRASMYVSNIIKSIRALFERNSSDPFTEIAMALHDALLFESNWTAYSTSQYKAAQVIIKQAAEDFQLTTKKVEKAVVSLSDEGFDILPFNLEI